MVTVGGGRSAAKKGRGVGITTAFWGILLVLGVLGNSVLVLLRSITADRGLSNASSTTTTTTPQITLSLANPNHYLDFIQGSLSSTTTTVQQPNPSPTGSFNVKSSNRVHNQRRESTTAEKAAVLPLLQKEKEEENNDSSISGKSPILKNNNHTTTVNIAKPYLKHNNDNSNTTVDIEKSAFSFCLLIKDDNDIMNEWIAYHYHTLNLRTIIVSIDPDSKTTPEPLLQAWRDQFDLHYEIWDDSKYMPDWFLNGHFEKVPRMIKWQDKNASKWQEEGANVSLEERQRAVLEINKHRYRQAKFLQHCAKYLQENEYTWTTHIDTDEYIVINPTYRKKKRGKVDLALHKPNVVYDHLIKMNKGGYNINWPCISMPRVLYGSVEDGNTTTLKERFESLRWKFHAAYDNDELNKQPKAIMDVSGFPPFDETKKAFSIHRPSIHLCRMQGQMNVKDWRKYPLTINHYLGSLERYQAREDTRRTVKAYKQKANLRDRKDDDWIDKWWTSFLADHGKEKVSKVMGKYMVTDAR